MAQEVRLSPKGLQTNPSELLANQGGMSVADNVVIDREGTLDARRGMALVDGSTVDSQPTQMFDFKETLMRMLDDGSVLNLDGGAYGTNPPPHVEQKTRSVVANGNLYTTSTSGVYRLEAPTPSAFDFQPAGVPRAIDIVQAVPTSGQTLISADSAVGYRAVFGIKDSNQNLKLGAPSPLLLVSQAPVTALCAAGDLNRILGVVTIHAGSTGIFQVGDVVSLSPGEADFPAGQKTITAVSGLDYSYAEVGAPAGSTVDQIFSLVSRRVAITVYIPVGITSTDYFVQLYRTAFVTGVASDPGDEVQLVYEQQLDGADLAAGFITIADIRPDSLRGTSAYWNQSQEGILNSNFPPPTCLDIAQFKGTTFFSNTSSRYRFSLNILGTGTGGLFPTMTVTIAGRLYTADTAFNQATNHFKVFSSGTPAQNLIDTSNSLCRCVNGDTGSGVYAFYSSAGTDPPGRILFEERSPGLAPNFVVGPTTIPTAFSPNINANSQSTNDVFLNGVYFSKPDEPEAVPELNFILVGASEAKILRSIALRDALFFWKEDGIYRLTGDSAANFNVTLLDNTVELIAPDTACALSNQIYALTTQGVVTVSDTGATVISRPIERDLLSIVHFDLNGIRFNAHAIPYESARQYILVMRYANPMSDKTWAFVYNLATQTWTRRDFNGTDGCATGIVSKSDDLLYVMQDFGSGAQALKERKDFLYTDFADADYPVTVTATSHSATLDTITISDTTHAQVGGIVILNSQTATILAVNTTSGLLTVAENVTTFGTGTARIYLPIACEAKLLPLTGIAALGAGSNGVPGMGKHFTKAVVFARNPNYGSMTFSFSSDISPEEEFVYTTALASGGWGAFPWGSVPWGGAEQSIPIRMTIPMEKQRCSQLTFGMSHALAQKMFSIEGIAVTARSVSERLIK